MYIYLHLVQQAIDEAVRGMHGRQLAWHREGKWNAASILEHLSLTYSGTARGMQRCLEAERPAPPRPVGASAWPALW